VIPFYMMILLFVFAGLMAGISAGLLGAGGGIVVVPLLAVIFLHHGEPITTAMHTAVGTSLAIMVITALSSTSAHAQHKRVRWDIFSKLAPGITLGALIGALIASALPGELLHRIFAVFLLLCSIQIAFQFLPTIKHVLLSRRSLSCFGFFSGMLAACLGIGGSVINVPYFVMNKIKMKEAVGTTAVSGFPVALVGSIVFVIAGLGKPNLPPHSFGFVNIPAWITISIVTTITAWYAAKLVDHLKSKALRWIFAGFLLVMAAGMLLE